MVLDKSIVKSDFLVLTKTHEKRVGFRRASRTVHYRDLSERKLTLFRHFVDGVLQGSFLHRFKFIEERHDQGGSKVGDRQHKDAESEPCPEPCIGNILKDEKNAGEERGSNHGCEENGFQLVHYKGSPCCFVKPEAPFQYERGVDCQRQAQNVISEKEAEDIDEAGGNFSKGEGARERVPPGESAEKPEAKEDCE